MKTLIIALASALSVNAQITEEHTYDNTINDNYPNYDYTNNYHGIINLGSVGEKYAFTNGSTIYDAIISSSVSFYNLDHSLYKTIDVNVNGLKASPTIPSNYIISWINPFYFTENLFDADSELEFLITYNINDGNSNYDYGIAIQKENGSIIFNEAGRQLNTIHNTTNGTKMVLSYSEYNGNWFEYKGVKVYALPGTFTGKTELKIEGVNISATPNPAQSFTNINYELPEGVYEGTLAIFNMNGNKVKEYKVGSHFKHIKVNTSELPTGSYLYQVTTSKGLSQGRKLIVIQ